MHASLRLSVVVLALCCSATSFFAQSAVDRPDLERGALAATRPEAPLVLGGDAIPDVVISPGTAGQPTRILSGATLAELGAGFPFGPGFGAGVRTALGELTGDTTTDIVVAMGPGGGLVRLFNGATIGEIASGYPFGAEFGGGVSVATGDINGDGRADIIVGQASNGGTLRVFSGTNIAVLLSQTPFGAGYAGGLNVASGDVDGDGRADVIVGQASGGQVAVISGATQQVLVSGAAYGPLPGGVFVAAGDVTGDGRAEVLAAPGTGNLPVLVYDVGAASVVTTLTPYASSPGGTRIAVTDTTGDGRVEIFTVPGPGAAADLRVYDGASFALLSSQLVYPAGYTGGAFISTAAPATLRFVSAAATTFATGAAGSFTVTTQGSPNATAITLSGALPTGVTFTSHGNGTGTLAGTPGPSTAGTYALTLTASTPAGLQVVQNFTLTVRQAPTITSPSSAVFAAGVSGTFTVVTSGLPTPAVNVTGTLPAGLAFVDNGNGTGTLSGTPAAGSGGQYAVTVNATNSVGGTATQNLAVTVNERPLITSGTAATFAVGVAGSFSMTATGQPTPALSSTGSLPSGVTLVDNGNGTASLAGTPAAGTGGQYALAVTATNGIGTPATQNFVLTVNAPPAITSGAAATFSVGAAGSFPITTSGYPVSTITVTGTLPTGVTLVNPGTGTATLAGTPAAGSGGSYVLNVSASNGIGAPATQTLVVTVTAAPAITSASATTFTAGTGGSFVVTTTGYPAPTLSRTGTLPSGVTFTNNGNGTATLSGTPAPGSGGQYSLSLTATNGVGAPATQTFLLTVNAAPAITSASTTAFTVGAAGSFTITTTGYPAPTLSRTGTLPSGVTFTNNGNGTATLAGTPGPGTSGSYPLTFTASNGVGSNATQGFTLNVGAADAQNETYTGGVGNTQFSVGAGTPATPAVVVSGSVLTNDTGVAPLSAGPASITTTNGGQVQMASNGSFLYTPPAGFAGPADTFIYTLTDAFGGTDSATVTINMSGVVWYVNAAASGGDGRAQSPFQTMSAASTAAQAGQTIYVHQGSPAGATTLKANQTLWGAGAAFTLNGLTIPAASSPTLQGTITLANGVLVRSLSVNGGAGAAIAGSGLTGTETLNTVTIVGGATGVSLTSVNGTVTITGGAISGVTGSDVVVSGGTGAISVGASITNTAGRSVDVQNRTGGAVTFLGPIVDTGLGVLLNNNTGSSVAFSGGLAVTTDTADAFTATGGGTVTATQNNTTIVNTLASTSGQGLRVVNTAIGPAGLTFRRIASGNAGYGPGVGITLDGTGVDAGAGALVVTGNGTPGSGGTIRRKSGSDGSLTSGLGIYLHDTKGTSLRWMELSDFDNGAILGRGVVGFTLQDSVIDGNVGTTASEGGLIFGTPNPSGVTGLTGAVLLRNVVVSGSAGHNAAFFNQSGSMSLQLEGTTRPVCGMSTNSATTGGDGLHLLAQGTAAATLTIGPCQFRGNRAAGLRVLAEDDSDVTVSITQTDIHHIGGQGNQGVVLQNAGNARLTGTIDQSSFDALPGANIWMGQTPFNASATSLLRVTVTNNEGFTQAPGASAPPWVIALSSTPGQVARSRILINNGVTNLVLSTATEALRITTPDAGTSPAGDITVLNTHTDTIQSVGAPNSVTISATQPGANICTRIVGNTFHWDPPTGIGGPLRVTQANGATFRLERGVSSIAATPATVLTANNDAQTLNEVFGTLTVVDNNTCVLPSAP